MSAPDRRQGEPDNELRCRHDWPPDAAQECPRCRMAEVHDKDEETIVVGVIRLEDGAGSQWELRVCGIPHAHGVAEHAGAALIEAAFVLRERADEAASEGEQ